MHAAAPHSTCRMRPLCSRLQQGVQQRRYTQEAAQRRRHVLAQARSGAGAYVRRELGRARALLGLGGVLGALRGQVVRAQRVELGLQLQQARLQLLHLPAVALRHRALVVAQDGHLRAARAAGGVRAGRGCGASARRRARARLGPRAAAPPLSAPGARLRRAPRRRGARAQHAERARPVCSPMSSLFRHSLLPHFPQGTHMRCIHKQDGGGSCAAGRRGTRGARGPQARASLFARS